MTSKPFAIIRKQTSYTTSSINLYLFSVMLASIHTTTQYHHKYKITDSGKPRIVLKARKFSFRATHTLLHLLRFTRAKFTCFLCCSEIISQNCWTSMDRMWNVIQEKPPLTHFLKNKTVTQATTALQTIPLPLEPLHFQTHFHYLNKMNGDSDICTTYWCWKYVTPAICCAYTKLSTHTHP
jgi:hypothetical protein